LKEHEAPLIITPRQLGDGHDLPAEAHGADQRQQVSPVQAPGVRRGEQVMPRVARASATAVSGRGRSPNSASAITGASTDDTAT